MVVKNTNNGSFEIKRWVAILTLIGLLLSFTYSVVMSFNISPIKKDVYENSKKNNEQDKELSDIDKKVAINSNNFKHIEQNLIEIKELIKNGKQN